MSWVATSDHLASSRRRNPVCNNLVHYIIIIIYSVVPEPSSPELNPWYCQVHSPHTIFAHFDCQQQCTNTSNILLATHETNAVLPFHVLIIMIITWTVLHHFHGIIILIPVLIVLLQLLIAYESGVICLWDMRGKMAEMRWQSAQPLRSISWHHEGKHFVSSHTDGSLCTWPLRPTPMPQYHNYPHGKFLIKVPVK